MQAMKIERAEHFSQFMRSLRGNTSQQDFAKLLGVAYGSIQVWERGQSISSTENLSRVAKVAGYGVDELICRIDGKLLPEVALASKCVIE